MVKPDAFLVHLAPSTMTLKALPLAYNKDMQEDKEGIFDAMPTWLACIHMAQACIKGIKVKGERTLAAAKGGHANARACRLLGS